MQSYDCWIMELKILQTVKKYKLPSKNLSPIKFPWL